MVKYWTYCEVIILIQRYHRLIVPLCHIVLCDTVDDFFSVRYVIDISLIIIVIKSKIISDKGFSIIALIFKMKMGVCV